MAGAVVASKGLGLRWLLGLFGSGSAGVGALGAFGVCHSVCQAAIALLAVFGITLTGMPLFGFMQFAQRWAWAFIGLGVLSIGATIVLHLRMRRC